MANLTTDHQDSIDEACKRLVIKSEDLFSVLIHCYLEIRDSEQIKRDLESLLMYLFADAKAATSSLFALAMEAMGTGKIIDQTSIHTYFSKSNVFYKPKATKEDLLSAIKIASSHLRSIGKDIGGIHIKQPVVDEILKWVNEYSPEKASIAALLEQAGSGKTVAMSVLLNRLENAGFITLGIKVDTLSFSSPAELTSAIGFPDSILSVLQHLKSLGHRMALLIDQVDALSASMSRDSSRISAILDLVASVADLQIPIVIACRSFDWKYDFHLRHIRDKKPTEFKLPELTDSQLQPILSTYLLKLSDLHPLTVKVIRCPLRLKIFIEIIQDRRQAEPDWKPTSPIYSLQSLYRDFWTLKMRKAVSDGIADDKCEAFVTLIAQRMHNAKTLSAPEALAIANRVIKDWLVSEGVLNINDKSISFFHQTFFDYIFARGFIGSSKSLAEHLLNSDQGLFFRPLVRQILEYLRDVCTQDYITELKAILENPKIRNHIRWMTVMWLGQNRDPMTQELSSMEPILSNTNRLYRVLKYFSGNSAWFDKLTGQRFDRLLCTLPDEEIPLIITYLRSLISDRQHEIMAILSPHLGKSVSWNNQIAFCLSGITGNWETESTDLLFRFLRNNLTSMEAPFEWWGSALMSLSKSNPKQACKAIRIVLDRFTTRWGSKDHEVKSAKEAFSQNQNSILPIAHEFSETLIFLGNTLPKEFLEHTLLWTLEAMQKTCKSPNDFSYKMNWQYWRYNEFNNSSPSENLLKATEAAFKNLSKSNPALFRTLLTNLLDSPYLPIQALISEAYSENPKEYASDAASFLATDARRLHLNVRRSAVGNTTDIIRSCSSYWTREESEQVEEAILRMKEAPSLQIRDLQWNGWTRFGLLKAFDQKRLSTKGLDQRGVLERKFPLFDSLINQQSEVGFVGPPIQKESIKKMDNKSWLSAMKKYDSDRIQNNKPLSTGGGRYQLAQELQIAAKEEPERFHTLAMDRMDESFHVDYVLAIIEGLSEIGFPVDLLENLILKFRIQLEQNSIHAVAWAIEKYAGKSIRPSLIELLKHWAGEAKDPIIEEFQIEGDDQDASCQLLTEGMNSDRGSALRSLGYLLLKSDPPRRSEFLDVAETVATDPSVAVRATCIDLLKYAIPADSIRACKLFRKLIGQDQPLLREQESYNFIYHILYKHAREVMWAIKEMLADEKNAKTREAGARLACLAAFMYSEAIPLRDTCIKGDIPVRKGAATIYSANISETQVGIECQEKLRMFFNDDALDVREETITFLLNLDASFIREHKDFLRMWARTLSLCEGAENAAIMLERDPLADQNLTLDISEHLLNALGKKLADLFYRQGRISYHLVPAILNVYNMAASIDVRQKAIDLFEKLEELGCWEVYSAMESIDRV
ncbi:MAG: hypothetical protein ACYDH0_11120 [Candidatus Aminicenantales bacterium]